MIMLRICTWVSRVKKVSKLDYLSQSRARVYIVTSIWLPDVGVFFAPRCLQVSPCVCVCVCVCGWQTPNPGLLQRHAGDLTWSCDVSTSRDVWLTWPQQTTLSVNSPWRWYVHLPDTERRLRQDGLYALTAKFHYASWFRARSEPVRSWFGASSELASIMQFGFYSSCCCDEAKHHLFDLLYNKL